MGRNAKKRLDYFPMDIDIFQDLKIRKLIKYQGGKAVTVYALLLCTIYKEGYYVKWDKELPFICSELTGFEEAYISEVLNTCLVLGLFDKTLFEKEQVLTSKGVQERYQRICQQSKRICSVEEYSLLAPTDNHTRKATAAKKGKQPSEKSKKSVRKAQSNHQLKPRQGKESPGTVQADLPFTNDTASPPHDNLPQSPTLDQEIELLKQDTTWLDTLQCLHHIDISQLRLRLDDFRTECAANGKDRHDTIADAKYHFNSWLRIATKIANETDKKRDDIKRSGNILPADAAQKKNYGSSF